MDHGSRTHLVRAVLDDEVPVVGNPAEPTTAALRSRPSCRCRRPRLRHFPPGYKNVPGGISVTAACICGEQRNEGGGKKSSTTGNIELQYYMHTCLCTQCKDTRRPVLRDTQYILIMQTICPPMSCPTTYTHGFDSRHEPNLGVKSAIL